MSTKEETIMCHGPHNAAATEIYKRGRQQAASNPSPFIVVSDPEMYSSAK